MTGPTSIEVIERVLNSGLLTDVLTLIPDDGASAEQIAGEQRHLALPLCDEHLQLLRRWNGLDLEVVRIYGCGDACPERLRLRHCQLVHSQFDSPMNAVGSDPSGFVYFQDASCAIWQLDTDGGGVQKVASDLTDFLCRVVFGRDGADFGGNDWLSELRDVGIVE